MDAQQLARGSALRGGTPPDPATGSQRLWAGGFAAVLIAAAVVSSPFRQHLFGVIPNFLQGYAIVLGSTETLTATLLVWRAHALRDARLATLAAAYAFSAPLIVGNVLTLPGIAGPAGTFPPQAAPWMWIAWHLGWGAFVAGFALQGPGATGAPRRWLAGAVLGALVIAVTLSLPGLPELVAAGGRFTPLLYVLYAAIVAVDVVALTALLRRRSAPTTLELWLAVAVVALTLDNAITALGGIRFSLGFYVARSLGMISGVVVLAALFTDLAQVIRSADVVRRYALVIDRLPLIAFIVDAEWSCSYVNPAWEHLTGQTAAQAAGFGYRAAIHPEDLVPLLRMPPGLGIDREVRLLDAATGDYRRHLVRAEPATAAGALGAPGFVATATDVEDRARAEAARSESDARLRTFLETVPQIVWTADADGWLDWYNRRWFEYTGQTPEEAAGWGWQAAHHPDDFPAVMERWPQSIATGEPFEMEFRLRRYDGEFQWFLTRVEPQRDASGATVRWYGANTNIDAQKREAQRSARVARMMQEALLPERMPQVDGVRFDALYLPAESDAVVGGDWYDAMRLPDGRILISCGDVAGHGLTAAVLAGRYRQSIAVTGIEDPDPARILTRVNRIATLQGDDVTTAVVAVLDVETLTLDYALAGHPPPIVARPGEAAQPLRSGGLPLGILPDAGWETHRVPLVRDAVVLFYTDGLTEFARDAIAAEQRLCAAAAALVGDVETPRPALAIKESVMDGAAPRDDVAFLAVQCSEVAASVLDSAATPLVKTWRFHSSDAQTAQHSRRTLAAYLAVHAAERSSLYEAELIVGEALANTVEHAPGLVEVVIDWTGEQPVLIVRDTGPGFEGRAAALPDEALSEDGRGLFLIQTLAGDLQIRRSPSFGTELRCTLPVRRAAGAQTDAVLGAS